MNVNNIISVVSVVLNNEDTIERFIVDVCNVLKNNYQHYELIVVDNGSHDETVSKACEAAKISKNIRVIVLSKNHEDEIAYTAALENAIGDYVVLMDCEYDPPEYIPEMVDICASGEDFVVAEQSDRSADPFWYRLLMYFFFKLFSIFVSPEVKTSLSNYICFSRSMVEAIVKVKDRVRLIRAMNVEVGYRKKIIQFERNGQPKRRDRKVLLKKIFYSLEVLFSSSNSILQAANLLSLIISLVSFSYVLYAFTMYFFKPDVAEGWTSTSIVIATFFGVMFLVLGIIGGYVSVIHKETKKGPLYHISREVSTGELYDLFEERNVE